MNAEQKRMDQMIQRGRRSDEIATELKVKEHFVMARMEEIARAEADAICERHNRHGGPPGLRRLFRFPQ